MPLPKRDRRLIDADRFAEFQLRQSSRSPKSFDVDIGNHQLNMENS